MCVGTFVCPVWREFCFENIRERGSVCTRIFFVIAGYSLAKGLRDDRRVLAFLEAICGRKPSVDGFFALFEPLLRNVFFPTKFELNGSFVYRTQ